MPDVQRFFFGRPSAGDRVLKAANRLKLDILQFGGDDEDQSHAICEFEVHGAIPLADPSAVSLMTELLKRFCLAGGKGGADYVA